MAGYAPFLMSLILIAGMVIEMRDGRLPNWLTMLPFVLFMALIVTAPDPAVFAGRLVGAAMVFVVGLVLFALAGFGAGAVKLLTGLALFIPAEKAVATFSIFIVTMFVGTFIILQIHKRVAAADSKWVILHKRVLPMSLPIGIAGLCAFWLI
ncbi:prepilin peptidase [Yoonia vestfoldensis]|jgi:prepilin peptidase CpaA|uniref:Type IV leader peptidase family protein n=1 Tax=Yoonia vestfoldensis TaxID=245188 RepID=A0A1Y0EB42_9RHOB|nr:A24 family peptidase [Yoonia vestfoldensis]ARU00610.1 type IV leader peptidase family protein [Yoonia vestfoldensis]